MIITKADNGLKNIIVGVCGSIAAYKICDLVRALTGKKYKVKCILTEAGKNFITPLTLQTLSQNKAYGEMFAGSACFTPEHVSLAEWAGLIVIAPATATTIAKLAAGLADNLLTNVVLASAAPVIICPAMNDLMWKNTVTQKNVEYLKKIGRIFVGPDTGMLASGKNGTGRLAPVETIFKEIEKHFPADSNQQTVKSKKSLTFNR